MFNKYIKYKNKYINLKYNFLSVGGGLESGREYSNSKKNLWDARNIKVELVNEHDKLQFFIDNYIGEDVDQFESGLPSLKEGYYEFIFKPVREKYEKEKKLYHITKLKYIPSILSNGLEESCDPTKHEIIKHGNNYITGVYGFITAQGPKWAKKEKVLFSNGLVINAIFEFIANDQDEEKEFITHITDRTLRETRKPILWAKDSGTDAQYAVKNSELYLSKMLVKIDTISEKFDTGFTYMRTTDINDSLKEDSTPPDEGLAEQQIAYRSALLSARRHRDDDLVILNFNELSLEAPKKWFTNFCEVNDELIFKIGIKKLYRDPFYVYKDGNGAAINSWDSFDTFDKKKLKTIEYINDEGQKVKLEMDKESYDESYDENYINFLQLKDMDNKRIKMVFSKSGR